MLHLVLYQPEIAPNAGNVARTCAVLGLSLHLIRPLGFTLGAQGFRRAGMDYLDGVDVRIHDSWSGYLAMLGASSRVFATSGSGNLVYSDVQFQSGDHLLFGPESVGLPIDILQKYPSLRLPMPGGGRSLNVAVTAAVMAFEAMRQITLGWQAK
jgi:tRNA (cytidine/uridine-2'-O-)-methyltransferase